MRIGEALGFRWSDCDFDNDIIHVTHTLLYKGQENGGYAYRISEPKTKAGIRDIPMLSDVKEELLLAEAEKREPLYLPKFSAHILRHTFCTRLCENETNIKVIQDVMGHKNIRTTMDVYNEATAAQKKLCFQGLDGK